MSQKDPVVIVSAARTPVGSFNGALATVPAHELGTVALRAAMERAGVEPGEVEEVIMGQILSAGQGHDARVVAAGGMESMSLAPHAQHLRSGTKMGELRLVDTMIHDALWDAFNDYHMGMWRRTNTSVKA